MSEITATSPNTTSQKGKVWFITGASFGFGLLLTEYLLSMGACVIATARKLDALNELITKYPAQLEILTLDVTNSKHIAAAVEDGLTRFGHVDVLVNNAGYGVMGAIEEVTPQEFMPMFNTNVFGLIELTKALLPQFRARRSGHIVNFSSIGGLIGGAGWGYYNATKFAVEGLSEALAQELKPLGIHVTIVEPGPFRTGFLGRSAIDAKEVLPDYVQTAGRAREYNATQAGKQPGGPAEGHRSCSEGSRIPRAAAASAARQARPRPLPHEDRQLAERNVHVGRNNARRRLSRRGSNRGAAALRNDQPRSRRLFTTNAEET